MGIVVVRGKFQNLHTPVMHTPVNKKITLPYFEVKTAEIINKFTVKDEKINFKVSDKRTQAFCEHSNIPLTIPSAVANISNIEQLTTVLNAHYIFLSIDNILKFHAQGIGGAIVRKNDKNISILDFKRPIGEILDKEHIIDTDVTIGNSNINTCGYNALASGIYQFDKETRKRIYSNMGLAEFNQFDLEDLYSKSSEKIFNKSLSNHLKRYAEKLTTLNDGSNHGTANIVDDKRLLAIANSLGIVLEIYNDEDKILVAHVFEYNVSFDEITSHPGEYKFLQADTASYMAAKLAGFVETNKLMFNHKLYLDCENLIEEKVKHFRELINNNWGKSKNEWVSSKSTCSGMRKYTEKLDIDFNVMKGYFDKKQYITKKAAIDALNDNIDDLADKFRKLLLKKFGSMPFIVLWNCEIIGKRYYHAINLQKLLDTSKVKKNGLEEKFDVTERKQSEIASTVVEPEQKEVTKFTDITLYDFKYPIKELLLEEHMLYTSGNRDMCGYYAMALGIGQFSSETKQTLYYKIGLDINSTKTLELLVWKGEDYQSMLGNQLRIFAEKKHLIRNNFNEISELEEHKTNIEANTLIAIANELKINLQLFQGNDKACHLDGTNLKIGNQDLKCLKSYAFTEICKHVGILYKDENGSYSLNYSSDIILNRNKSIDYNIKKVKKLIKNSFDDPALYRSLMDNKYVDDGWAEDLIKKYAIPKYKSSNDAIKEFEEDTKQVKEDVDDLIRKYTSNGLPLIVIWNAWGNADYGHYQAVDLQKLIGRAKTIPNLELLRISNVESNMLEETFGDTQPKQAITDDFLTQPDKKLSIQDLIPPIAVWNHTKTNLHQGAQPEESFELKEPSYAPEDIEEVASYISLETNRVNILKAEFTKILSWYPDINCIEYQFLNRIVSTIDLEIAVKGGIKEDILVALDTFLNNDDSHIDIIYNFLEESYLSLLLQPFKGGNIPSNITIISFFKEITKYIESGLITQSHLRDYIEVLIKYGNEIPQEIKGSIDSIVDLIKNKPEFYSYALKAVLDQSGAIKYDIFEAIYSGTNLSIFITQDKNSNDIKLWAHAANDFKMLEIINELLWRLLPDKEQHKKIELFWAQTRLDKSSYIKALENQISLISKFNHKAILFEYFLNICLNNKTLVQVLYESGPSIEVLKSLVSEFLNIELKEYNEQINKHICNPFLIKFCSYFRRLERDYHDTIAIPLLLSLIIHTDTEEIARFRDFENTFDNMVDALQFVFANLSNNCFNGVPRKLLEYLLVYIKDVFNKINAPCKIKLEILKSYLDAIMYIKLDDIVPKDNMPSKKRAELITGAVNSYLCNYSSANELLQKSNKLQNQLFHFLCRQRYSFNDFRGWFDGENHHLPLDIRSNIINNMESTRKEIGEDDKVLKKYGFEYIHHNQIAALTTVNNYINDYNIFLKLATGQGKSLIAEYAAIQMLEKDPTIKRVFIFTTYDHLAERDQANMKFLCDAETHKIDTLYVGSMKDIEKIPLDQKAIIHVDADKFALSLGEFLTEILNSNLFETEIERIKAIERIKRFKQIYDPSNCGAILDEGDLMLLDNRRSSYVHNFKSLFGLSGPIKMQSDRNQFENLIGKDFIRQIREDFGDAFGDAFGEWYRDESSRTGGEKKGMDNASGKRIHYAKTFADELSRGQFQAFPGETNIVAYVRNFKHIVVLSGSLEDKHIRLFDGVFVNGRESPKKPKPNLFIKIPVFYGSHNRGLNLKSITEKGYLKNETWIAEIENDIKQAINRKQPVLVFCDIGKITAFKENLDSKFSKQTIRVISKEIEVKDGEKTTGEPNTITLATTIMGRGVDIKVSKHIKDGLHVIITKLPEDYNDRLLTQMQGRTARLDNKGTFSIIVQDSYDDFKANSEKHKPISVSKEKNFLLYEVTKYFLDLFSTSYEEARKNIAKRWVIFFLLFKNGYIKENDIKKIKLFIENHVVKN